MIFKNILLSLFVVVMYGTWRTRLVPTSSHWGPLRMIVINVYVCAYFRPSAFFGTNHIKNISYACFFVLHRSYIITLDLQNYLSVFSLFIMRHLCCVVFPAIRRLNLRVLSDSVFHVRNLSLIPGSFSAFSVDLFSISFRPSNSIFLALRRTRGKNGAFMCEHILSLCMFMFVCPGPKPNRRDLMIKKCE